MIKLQDQVLSSPSLKQLAKHQAVVNSVPDCAGQVEKAQSIWKPRNRAFTEITEKLIAMCPGTQRCCYCEDAMGTDIEHFKPKHLYPDIAFQWTNYLFACAACNSNAKRNQFAIIDTANVLHDVTRGKNDPVVQPKSGKPALINPRYEDPLKFLRIDLLNTFYFLPRADLSPVDKLRARYTIDVLQLNIRAELVDWRKQAYKNFVGWIDTYKRYKISSPARLKNHQSTLRTYTHLAVWEEMKRYYRERDEKRWQYLKTRYDVIAELDELFTSLPEVLTIRI